MIILKTWNTTNAHANDADTPGLLEQRTQKRVQTVSATIGERKRRNNMEDKILILQNLLRIAYLINADKDTDAIRVICETMDMVTGEYAEKQIQQ